jgi:DNA-binding MarR family transcriptional regulator
MNQETSIRPDQAQLAWKRAITGILSTGYWISDRLNEVLKPFGLSEQQLNVLSILKRQPDMTGNLSEIQTQMMHKMSNATRLVEKLRLKGMVTRELDSENRRKVEIKITRKGLALLEQVQKKLNECHHPFYESKMCQEEYHRLADLLEKFRG